MISLGPARLRNLLFVPLMIAWALLGVGLGPLPHAQAQPRDNEDSAVRHIVVTVNKSRTLRIEKPFASAVVGSPDIVDALPMSDRTLYIQGKKVGTTNVSVFDQTMQLIGVIEVEVTLDTGNLQEKIRASTGSRAIRVGSSNGQIVLSGVAGNAVAAERAVQVAKSMVAEGGSYRERDDGGSGAAGHAQGPLSRGRTLRESRVRGELVRGQQWREPRLCHRNRRR